MLCKGYTSLCTVHCNTDRAPSDKRGTAGLLSNKEERSGATCTAQMDLIIITLSERSQTNRVDMVWRHADYNRGKLNSSTDQQPSRGYMQGTTSHLWKLLLVSRADLQQTSAARQNCKPQGKGKPGGIF